MVWEIMTHEESEGLNFSFDRCDDEQKRDGIQSVTNSGNKLLIDAVVHPNCASIWLLGDYIKNGREIKLSYSQMAYGVMACSCAHNVRYEIEGVEGTDYDIAFVEGGWVDISPWLYKKLVGVSDYAP